MHVAVQKVNLCGVYPLDTRKGCNIALSGLKTRLERGRPQGRFSPLSVVPSLFSELASSLLAERLPLDYGSPMNMTLRDFMAQREGEIRDHLKALKAELKELQLAKSALDAAGPPTNGAAS